jgi:hypothetical protein
MEGKNKAPLVAGLICDNGSLSKEFPTQNKTSK